MLEEMGVEERVVALRTERGISQREVARILEVS
jgi:transcriptional regulator with XRE-family HTH domain